MRRTALSPKSDIVEFSTLQTGCVYLEDELMKMQYKYIKCSTPSLNTKLISRGWRRFGDYYSRPNCNSCSKCQSLRINVEKFEFTKSVRKVLSKNSDTKIIIRKPSVSKEHLILYEKYHKFMQLKKSWDYYNINSDSYYDLYVKGFGEFGKEILYIRDNKLVGVDLVDFLDDGLSSIYFYYDPDFSKFSLGNYSIYKQIEMAKREELKWIYLGYYVKECGSLSYKINYKPYEILQNNPNFDEESIWR